MSTTTDTLAAAHDIPETLTREQAAERLAASARHDEYDIGELLARPRDFIRMYEVKEAGNRETATILRAYVRGLDDPDDPDAPDAPIPAAHGVTPCACGAVQNHETTPRCDPLAGLPADVASRIVRDAAEEKRMAAIRTETAWDGPEARQAHDAAIVRGVAAYRASQQPRMAVEFAPGWDADWPRSLGITDDVRESPTRSSVNDALRALGVAIGNASITRTHDARALEAAYERLTTAIAQAQAAERPRPLQVLSRREAPPVDLTDYDDPLADHTTGKRPAVTGGECSECLHRPPMHEPTCSRLVADASIEARAQKAAEVYDAVYEKAASDGDPVPMVPAWEAVVRAVDASAKPLPADLDERAQQAADLFVDTAMPDASSSLRVATKLQQRAHGEAWKAVVRFLETSRTATAERTPEVVLRAMLLAYEQATFDASVAYFSADADTVEERAHRKQAQRLHRQCEVIRREAAGTAAGHLDPVSFDVPGEMTAGSGRLMADYEARLRGDKPLDVPPEGT